MVAQDNAAHPRSRGENSDGLSHPLTDGGSSPLTRGKLDIPGVTGCNKGLIPAHAGKTHSPPARWLQRRAHPRSRGENERTRTMMNNFEGSSPLTRGKPLPGRLASGSGGLIPAHAGKTASAGTGRGPPGAHPRSRGENVVPPTTSVQSMGSSPLTRGKPLRSGCRGGGWRLIPAHAGKTPGYPHLHGDGRAHPRSRGENSMLKDRLRYEDGSSPLTRGKQNMPLIRLATSGLIPAHAGKTR